MEFPLLVEGTRDPVSPCTSDWEALEPGVKRPIGQEAGRSVCAGGSASQLPWSSSPLKFGRAACE